MKTTKKEVRRNLYFQDSNGDKRIVVLNIPESKVHQHIGIFCKQRNFRIYYTRSWRSKTGIEYDVGSHSEFFYWDINAN